MSAQFQNPLPKSGHRIGAKNNRACTTCRQVKLRCDSAQTFPSPCSRCKRGNLQCRIDPDFKRTRARHQLDEVTSQLNAIQKTLEMNSATSSPHARPLSSTSWGESRRGSRVADPSTRVHENDLTSTNEDSFYKMSSSEDLPNSSVSLGSAALERENLIVLFAHFKEFYLRHCPIFNFDMSLAELYHSVPFLFWTIVIIASRWHPSLSHLYGELEGPYQDLLARTIIAPILTLATIQGLVLLCIWPLAVAKQQYDPSWNYCGLLTNAATKLGIHKCSMVTDGQETPSEDDARVHLKTWMACYLVNCSHSWHTGVSVSSKFTVALRTPPPPRTRAENDFVTKVAVLRQFAKSTSILGRLDSETDGLALVQIMCKELGALRDDHKEVWSLEAEILVLGSQLTLFALQLESAALYQASLTKASKSPQTNTSWNVLVNLAFMVAIRLIHNFSELTTTSASADNMNEAPTTTSYSTTEDANPAIGYGPSSHPIYRYLPKHYMLMLALAATLIFKVRAAYPEVIKYNDDLGQNHIRIAYDLLGRWSMKKDDEPSRIQRVIEVLSRAERQQILNLKESRIQTEPGSGITVLKDAALTAKSLRERVGIVVTEQGETTDLNSMFLGPTDDLDLNRLGGEAQMEDSFLDSYFPWGLDIPLGLGEYDFGIQAYLTDPDSATFRPDRGTTAFGYYA